MSVVERSRGILPAEGKFHRSLSTPPCRVNRHAAEVGRCVVERSRGILPAEGKFHRSLSTPPCRVNRHAAEVGRCVVERSRGIQMMRYSCALSRNDGIARAMNQSSAVRVVLASMPHITTVGSRNCISARTCSCPSTTYAFGNRVA